MKFNKFCHKVLDGLYDPNISEEEQCTGYKQLKKMLIEKISPASKYEYDRWKNNPTKEDLSSVPHIKYLQFLHPITREYVIDNWLYIIGLELD